MVRNLKCGSVRCPQRTFLFLASFLLRTADATATTLFLHKRAQDGGFEIFTGMAGKAYIGTSGWNYKRWRNDFYGDTPQKKWLRFCAERFTAIEVNSTFYRLQPQSTFEKWREEKGGGVSFFIKRDRYLTHKQK